jgi:hypothetical protein
MYRVLTQWETPEEIGLSQILSVREVTCVGWQVGIDGLGSAELDSPGRALEGRPTLGG